MIVNIAAQEKIEASKAHFVIVVQGAGGNPQYQKTFTESCQKLRIAAVQAKSEFVWIGQPSTAATDSQGTTPDRSTSAKEQLKRVLTQQQSGTSQLWMILIGHGTFDRQSAKFNLEGPDLTARELNEWLTPIQRPVAIINCSSASAPFINRLTGAGRVIVTATKSGFELNYARFGKFFADALSNPAADIDKDEQVSLLESYLYAARQVEEYYQAESRLSTEHALIDDNGDGKGTPLGFFRGVRVVKKSSDDKSIPDGVLANQIHLIQSEFEKLISAESRKQRLRLEADLEKLRNRKADMAEKDYLSELEKITYQLAILYRDIEQSRSLENEKSAADSDASKLKPDLAPSDEKTELKKSKLM